MRLLLRIAVLVAASFALSSNGFAQASDQLCASCHTEEAQSLKASAHASLSCTTCHAGITGFPHPKHITLPRCSQCHAEEANEWARSVHGQAFASGNKAAPACQTCHGSAHSLLRPHTWEFKKSIPALCGRCHAAVLTKYLESIHGQALARGVVAVPVCSTCHHAHLILAPGNPGSSVYPTHIPETCGQCHGNVRLSREYGLPSNRLLTYEASFHGLMNREGSTVAANCASCHGIHLILPSSDPRSSINPKNLPRTCGKCHPGAGTTFAIGPVHQMPGQGVGWAAVAGKWIRIFYFIVIPLTIGFMLIHNLGDWLRKLARVRFEKKALQGEARAAKDGGEIRMFGFERLEHILLLTSFLVLVWTGFALKYPSGWWAQIFMHWETQGTPVRGIIHRVAAVVFIGVAVMHVISLISSRRLRRHWKELWPVRGDVKEFLRRFAFNLGWSSRHPELSRHSYVEKTEYWAMVWGTVIMTITGLMLWAHNLVLTWLPKVALDLAGQIHFYEAILAALAIVVWHFYSVIFDPDVYPMDTAWLTGKSPRGHFAGQDPETGALDPPAGDSQKAGVAPAVPPGQSANSEPGKRTGATKGTESKEND